MTRLLEQQPGTSCRAPPSTVTGARRGRCAPHPEHAEGARHVRAGPLRELVDAGGLSPNTWERLERLSAAWEQAKPGIVSARPLVTEPEPGAVSNPTRRSRTPLTPEEVDAIRTARTNGESVLSIAKRFGVHRVTVWEQTKNS